MLATETAGHVRETRRVSPEWRARASVRLLLVAWAILIVFLAVFHLEDYPTIWFDEGSLLHVPKDLVTFGIYADHSSEGFRFFGPTVGVGPTVLLPIALSFKLLGISLLAARLVMAVYLIAAVGLFVEVTRRQFGFGASWLASLLLISTPGVSFLYLGRQVAGEVPSFAFLLLGFLLWWRSVELNRRWRSSLVLAGVAFGLASVSKNQVGLILVPSLLILFLVDRYYYKCLKLVHLAVPLVLIAGVILSDYMFLVMSMSGRQDPEHLLTLLRNASGGAIFVFSPARALSSLKFLFGPDDFGYWGIPAVAYGLLLARERSLRGMQRATLVAVTVVGLGWYAFGSIGWPRYAFVPLALTSAFAARLMLDLGHLLSRAEGAGLTHRGRRFGIVGTITGGAFAILVAYQLAGQIRAVVATADRSPQLVAAYLDAHVSTSQVIETWEPELGFLTDHPYHYPPPEWLDRAVRATERHDPALVGGYRPLTQAQPAYLVVGRFGKFTGIYAPLLSSANVTYLTAIGEYSIYEVHTR